MAVSLPDVITAYFEVSNGADITHLTHCFTPDAVVLDEGRIHRGHEAIQSWQREAQMKSEYSVEPLGVVREGDRMTVTAKVAGNFPGSPVQLEHVFDLAGDKIRSLEIKP